MQMTCTRALDPQSIVCQKHKGLSSSSPNQPLCLSPFPPVYTPSSSTVTYVTSSLSGQFLLNPYGASHRLQQKAASSVWVSASPCLVLSLKSGRSAATPTHDMRPGPLSPCKGGVG